MSFSNQDPPVSGSSAPNHLLVASTYFVPRAVVPFDTPDG